MSTLDGLLDHPNREYAKDPELIDGSDPHEVAKLVDLSFAHSPILTRRYAWPPMGEIPEPDKPKRDGMRYYLMWPRQQQWEWLTEEAHKIARARFLLWRNWFYKTFDGFSHPEKQKIVAWYFDGQMWRPQQGSDLAKAMGLA